LLDGRTDGLDLFDCVGELAIALNGISRNAMILGELLGSSRWPILDPLLRVLICPRAATRVFEPVTAVRCG